jgi:hypothetical protein
MITIRHEFTVSTPAEVADWLARAGYTGTLTAYVDGKEIRPEFGRISSVGEVGYVNAQQAAQAWVARIWREADATRGW